MSKTAPQVPTTALGITSKPGFIRRFIDAFKLTKAYGDGRDQGQMLRSMDTFAQTYLGRDAWLTGGLPLTPKNEEGSPPRQFQYQPGYNIAIQPRSSEAFTFAQLRSLGDYTLVRIVIERVKEAIKAHEWDVVVEEEYKGYDGEAEIRWVKNLLECPDHIHAWDEWLGMLLEDALVIDAPAVFIHRTRAGQLWGLEIVDGATIKPLIDERGMTPLPPVPAYQQFLYGVPYVNLTMDDLIYRPRNRRVNHFYGFSPVEQIAVTVNQGFRRELYNLAQFTDGNIPAAFGQLPPDWKAEEIKQFQTYWDAILSGDPQNRSRIRWLPGGPGVGITKMRDEEVFGLFNKYDEWMARIVTYAFGMSPISFVQMTNRAVSQELGDTEAEQGLASVKLFVERLVNDIIDDVLLVPHLRFNWVTDRSRMQAKVVDKNVAYVKAGIYTVDEVRAEEGKPPIATLTPIQPMIPVQGQEQQVQQEAFPADAYAQQYDVPAMTEPNPDFQSNPSSPGDLGWQSHVIGPITTKAVMVARDRELSVWKTYAINRFTVKKSTGGFRPEFVSPVEAAQIEAGLKKAATLDGIAHLFASRRKRLPEVRLAPPRAGEAADRRNDLTVALRSALQAEARRVAGEKNGGRSEA